MIMVTLKRKYSIIAVATAAVGTRAAGYFVAMCALVCGEGYLVHLLDITNSGETSTYFIKSKDSKSASPFFLATKPCVINLRMIFVGVNAALRCNHLTPLYTAQKGFVFIWVRNPPCTTISSGTSSAYYWDCCRYELSQQDIHNCGQLVCIAGYF